MAAFVTAGAGFLLAVLWFDLMFDVQALAHRRGPVPEPVLASIAGYYARVTTAARPMNRLVALAMLGTIAAVVAQLARGDAPTGVSAASLVLVATAVTLAAARTVPHAVRLGQRVDPPARQADLARAIGRDHLICLTLLVALLVLQLVSA